MPKGVTGDALLDFVNMQLFPRLKGLPTKGEVGRRAQVVRAVFEDAINFMKSGTLMRQVINKINEIDFNNTEDRHTFGAIYEKILKDLQSAGNAGEFSHATRRHAPGCRPAQSSPPNSRDRLRPGLRNRRFSGPARSTT